MNYVTNTRHICTYLNAFFMLIPNIVMNFNHLKKIGFSFFVGESYGSWPGGVVYSCLPHGKSYPPYHKSDTFDLERILCTMS